jgi:hypothetical protein
MVDVATFNETYIIDWVRKKFGDPTVQVELDETQIVQCIDDTIELFQKYRPKEQYTNQQLAKGYYLVDVPSFDAIGVLDVEFVRKEYMSFESIEGALLYDPFYFLSAGGISGIDITTYANVRQWVEIISRLFGAEEGYILLDDGSLFVQVPGTFDVTFKWAMPWDDLTGLHRPYQQIFLNLVLAKSRQILGHIRGKFNQGVPGAGGMIQLDGDYQREKGAADEEKYLDELMRISPHFIPSLG